MTVDSQEGRSTQAAKLQTQEGPSTPPCQWHSTQGLGSCRPFGLYQPLQDRYDSGHLCSACDYKDFASQKASREKQIGADVKTAEPPGSVEILWGQGQRSVFRAKPVAGQLGACGLHERFRLEASLMEKAEEHRTALGLDTT